MNFNEAKEILNENGYICENNNLIWGGKPSKIFKILEYLFKNRDGAKSRDLAKLFFNGNGQNLISFMDKNEEYISNNGDIHNSIWTITDFGIKAYENALQKINSSKDNKQIKLPKIEAISFYNDETQKTEHIKLNGKFKNFNEFVNYVQNSLVYWDNEDDYVKLYVEIFGKSLFVDSQHWPYDDKYVAGENMEDAFKKYKLDLNKNSYTFIEQALENIRFIDSNGETHYFGRSEKGKQLMFMKFN